MTKKPFPPSICSCMATELLRSSTRKASKVALHVKYKYLSDFTTSKSVFIIKFSLSAAIR